MFGLSLVAGLSQISAATGQPVQTAEVIWDGGFRPGSVPWKGFQAREGSFDVVPAPGRSGWAASFLVRPGDSPISSGERAEVFQPTGEVAGTESYWVWSVYFPREFVADTGSWNVFTQWHHTGSSGVPPVAFEVNNQGGGNEFLQFRVWGGDQNAAARNSWLFARLTRERWYDFVLRIRWADEAQGLVQLWVNGKPVVSRLNIPTLYRGQGVYLKQGFYRGPFSATTKVYIANTRRLDSLDGLSVTYRPERHPRFPDI